MAFKGIRNSPTHTLAPQRRQDTGAPECTPEDLWYDEEFEPIADPATIPRSLTNSSKNTEPYQLSTDFDSSIFPKLMAQIEALCRFLKWNSDDQNDLESLAKQNTRLCQQLVEDLYTQYVQPLVERQADPFQQLIHQNQDGCFIQYVLPDVKVFLQLSIRSDQSLYYFNGSTFFW